MLIDAQRLIDCLPAPVALLDGAGVIVLVNAAWRQIAIINGLRDPLFGVGANYLQICDLAAGEDSEIAGAAAKGLRAVAAGRPEFNLKYPCHSPSQERWIDLRASYLGGDQRARVMVMHTDVSDFAAAVQAAELRARENELYRAMIDTLPDLIYAKDRQSCFLAANKATAQMMRAGSAAALIGKSDVDFYPPEIAAQFKADEETFFAQGDTIIIEQPTRRPDGSPGWLCSLKTPLDTGQGGVVGYVGHGRDVTEEKLKDQALAEARSQLERQTEELRALSEAAEQANRAKSEFLAAMSHEIRTPMTAVLGMADLLAGEELSLAQKRYVDAIRSSGRHLLSIINSILDFSRIEAGRMDLERIDFLLADVLEQTRSILAPQAAERGLELRFEPTPAASLVMRGDPTRLQQVLVNLIGNGLKFTAHGRVTSAVHQLQSLAGEPRLRFEVRDTGIGIPRERQAELFRPFVQATKSIARHFGGSGLGLAICRRLVEAMGGTIGLQSEPGQGSLAWFELPFEPGDVAVAAKRSACEPAPMRPLRILVVDDVAANRDLLDAMLSRYGHSVLLAANGATALELVISGQPDVVLMDVQMPVMDGLEATRRIRLLPEPACSVPILALTANVIASERERYLASGMSGCLTKPVIWPDLFAALAEVESAGRSLQLDRPMQADAVAIAAESNAPTMPLLDRAMLDELAARLPPATFRRLLQRGLDGAAQSHRRLTERAGDLASIAEESHRLRGTAGTFGLSRIAALAGMIEDRNAQGKNIADLLTELETAIDATSMAAGQLECQRRHRL